jgi:hypothetical protein
MKKILSIICVLSIASCGQSKKEDEGASKKVLCDSVEVITTEIDGIETSQTIYKCVTLPTSIKLVCDSVKVITTEMDGTETYEMTYKCDSVPVY